MLNCHAGCSFKEICVALDVKPSELTGKTPSAAVYGKTQYPSIVATYEYKDLNGKTLLLKHRTSNKDFWWYNPIVKKKGKNGVPDMLYRQELVPAAASVFLVEGEKDADNINRLSGSVFPFPAVSPSNGCETPWKKEFSELLKGKNVIILPDNDEPGEKLALKAAENLKGYAEHIFIAHLKDVFPDLPEKGDISDALQKYGNEAVRAALPKLLNEGNIHGVEGAQIKEEYLLISLDDVQSSKTEYLFPPYVPKGTVTILAGVSGGGKTWFSLYLAKLVSTGEPLTEGFPKKEPGTVIYQSKENDLSKDLKPRLEKLKADTSKILVIDDHDKDGKYNPVRLNDERLEPILKKVRPALVFFDPIQSYLGAEADMNKANTVRPILDKLIDLAQRYNVAIVLVAHMNKDSKAFALDKILGSSDFRNSARSILICGTDPYAEDYPNSRVIVQAKNSAGPLGDGITFHIDDSGLVIDGTCDLDADEIMPIRRDRRGKNKPAVCLDDAKDVILELLGDEGYCEAKAIYELAGMRGISKRTLYNARDEMHLQSVKIGFGKNKVTWWLSPDVDKETFKAERKNNAEQLTVS